MPQKDSSMEDSDARKFAKIDSHIATGLLLFTTRSAAQSFSFNPIDVPCSATLPTSCPNGIARQTVANGINPAGTSSGSSRMELASNTDSCLVEGNSPRLIFLAGLPRALMELVRQGILSGITRPRTSQGLAIRLLRTRQPTARGCSPACIKGFLYRHGKFSTVLFPGHPGAVPQRIAPDGDIYGCLHDFDLMNSMFGAAWGRIGESS